RRNGKHTAIKKREMLPRADKQQLAPPPQSAATHSVTAAALYLAQNATLLNENHCDEIQRPVQPPTNSRRQLRRRRKPRSGRENKRGQCAKATRPRTQPSSP